MTKPRTVYLDQFAISNAFKDRRRGRETTWQRLVESLGRARDRGTVLCPTSQWHEAESMLHRDGRSILAFARKLAQVPGPNPTVLRARDKWELLSAATVPALYRYLDHEPPTRKAQPWAAVDPHVLPKARSSEGWRRRQEREKARLGRSLRASALGPWRNPETSFLDAKKEEIVVRERMVLASFIAHGLGLLESAPPGAAFIQRLGDVVHRLTRAQGDRLFRILRTFFGSSDYASVASIAIEAGLWAAARESSKSGSHSVSPNDVIDFEMLAYLGPHLDVVVVDRRTGQLARQPRVDLAKHAPRLRVVAGAREVEVLVDEVDQW